MTNPVEHGWKADKHGPGQEEAENPSRIKEGGRLPCTATNSLLIVTLCSERCTVMYDALIEAARGAAGKDNASREETARTVVITKKSEQRTSPKTFPFI